jgi:glycosyltransferase involved in cell wall biosynthesis
VNVAAIIIGTGYEELLPRALKSISKQTYAASKIIVVDNKSPDKSLLAKYNAEFIQCDQLSYPKMLQLAISTLDNSVDAVAVLLSKDFYYADKISSAVNILEKYNHVGLVYSDADTQDANKDKVSTNFAPPYNEKFLGGNFFPSNNIIRVSMINDFGRTEFADLELMRRASMNWVAYLIPEPKCCISIPKVKNG